MFKSVISDLGSYLNSRYSIPPWLAPTTHGGLAGSSPRRRRESVETVGCSPLHYALAIATLIDSAEAGACFMDAARQEDVRHENRPEPVDLHFFYHPDSHHGRHPRAEQYPKQQARLPDEQCIIRYLSPVEARYTLVPAMRERSVTAGPSTNAPKKWKKQQTLPMVMCRMPSRNGASVPRSRSRQWEN
jgi:hypothetical protein